METYRMHDDASVYFVTYSVVEWLPVFVSGDACQIVADSLSFCHTEKGLRINAYVIMPTHMHAIVFDHEHSSIRLQETLSAFRKYTGRALSDYVVKHLPPCFGDVLRSTRQPDRSRQFWQPTRHPVSITSPEFLDQKRFYIHENPVRKGIAHFAVDWRYSSARIHADMKDATSDVPITFMES